MAARRKREANADGGDTDARIYAHVVLKGPEGTSPTDEALSVENIRQFVSTPASQERTRDFLEARGFSIERVGPFSMAISGPRQRFEELFGSRLQPLAPGPRTRTVAAGLGVGWTWVSPPRIPKELESVVDSVVLPERTKIG